MTHEANIHNNIQFIKSNLTNLIYSEAQFEDIHATYDQVGELLQGNKLQSVSDDDQLVIANLRDAWNYIITEIPDLNLSTIKTINGFVAKDESLEWGQLRTGNIQISGVSYIPPIPDEETVERSLTQVMGEGSALLDTTLELMLYLMRSQLFWDGNKRTAIVAANAILMGKGHHLINVPLRQFDMFNRLISQYYMDGNANRMIDWMKMYCVVAIDK